MFMNEKMNKKKMWIIILSSIIGILALIIIFILVYFNFKFNETHEKFNINDNIGNSSDSNVNNDKLDSENQSDSNSDSKEEDNIGSSNDNSESNNSENNNQNYDYNDSAVGTEEDVVSYFEGLNDDVSKSSSFKEKFKEYFTTVIDFIFYNKEVKGYTFNELTDMAKIKIIAVALKIDSKLEELFPNYKETISNTSSKIYNDVKGRLVTLYMDTASKVCENNENECARVKEIFTGIKDVCKITWDFILELLSNAASKIKDWYEIYSGK